ncbi:MAG: hypothetical protein Kow0013_19750 [Pararhodobacter sp.]
MIIALAALVAGRRQARRATDDLYRHVVARFERQTHCVSMALFVAMAVVCTRGLVPWNAGFAALGCLMGASCLALFVRHDPRVR